MGITPGTKVQVREKEYILSYDVKLERVLGLTVSTNSGLDCDPNTQLIAYPAGCAVVLFNPVKSRQSHLLNTCRKTVTCVSFSPDGKYLATGECGHVPSVRVWDLSDSSQIAEFPGHKYGINCLAFSPSQKYVVSVGSQHDMIVNVWDWKSGVKIASNKVSTKVRAIAFAVNGNYFVTVGNRHVKFWYLEYSRSAKYKEPVPLMGRSAILGEQRNNDFCDVACGKGSTGGSTYAVTRSGLLCEFNNRRLLDKWVELRTTSANCMAVGENHIFIGCAEGIVRCFSPLTLQFITTLPRTHYLGVDVAQGLNISHMASHPKNAKYPDAIALAFDEINGKLTCVYNDHSLYVWDVRDIKRVGKAHSFLYHSACIWGVEMYPDNSENKSIPAGSFLTCSSDDTIRVWNLDFTESQENNSLYRRNIYSNELLKILYVDPEYTYLKDIDITGTEKGDNASYDSRNGVRSIRISPDGNHLASGDRSGNIRIHDVHTLAEQCLIEAHDAEVLCLEYSRFENSERNLLASASRDRLIHIFNVNEEYNFVQTLDDHSSSITSVRFLNSNGQQQMVSCGADKSIIFRHLQGDQFTRGHNAAGKTTLYDMEVDFTQKHVLTACQDRNIRVYSVNSGKHTKTFKGSVGEDGSLIKITLDASGILVATSCTDKTLCIYDYYSSECLATMLGHSELATGLRFTNDCTRLISASGDGCIFVWKVPHDLVVTMHARLSQQAARAGKKLNGIGVYSSDSEIFGRPPNEMLDPNANAVTDNDYRFSVGQLPLWAKKQISDRDVPASEGPRTLERPKGRWAQRLDPSDKRLDSDGSKEDSSIDSGTETSRSLFHQDIRRETMIITKQITDTSKITLTRGGELHQQRSRHLTDDSSLGSFKYEDIESTEHDGDVEDCSEGESTEAEPRHQLIYYPATEDTNSDYTVNAMDVEELRRSQRRTKRLDLLLVPGETSQSVSGSQESDDDEQASTPSGENSERNMMTMLSASSESLDVISSREIFFKNTFESLSGAEMEKDPSPKTGKRSISSQHLGSAPRNSTVIQAARHAKNDVETSKKRKELQRRIEETRRQLNSVGYRSNLKSSQSTQDLSPRGKGFHDNKTIKQTHLPSNARLQATNLDDDTSTGGIRRACSLSDLATPSINKQHQLHANHLQGSSKSTSRSGPNRTVSRHTVSKPLNSMTRSSSVGVLNQSDSESDLNHQHSGSLMRTNRVMRPTISSQNKAISAVTKMAPLPARRRGMANAYSSMALNQTGDNEDSSSEEGKNNHIGRQRSASHDRSNAVIMSPPHRRAGTGLGRSGSERDLAHSQRMSQRPGTKIQRSSSGLIRTVSNQDPNSTEFQAKDGGNVVDIASAPLSQQLIASISEQLMRATDSVIQLHKRLAVEPVNPSDREVLLTDLQGAVGEAQKSLRLVEPASDTSVANKIQEVLTSNESGGNVVSALQQYSDILVSLVQQRMSNESKK